MPKPTPTRHRTKNWANYNAAPRMRASLLIWIDRG